MALLALSCAGPYHPRRLELGYDDRRLEQGQHWVRFESSSLLTEEEAHQLLLRRCAEISLEQGSRYFGVRDVSVQVRTAYGDAQGESYRFVATLLILPKAAGEPGVEDAVQVVQDTEKLARGRLSSRARDSIRLLKQGT